MVDVTGFITIAIAFFVAVASPGPAILAVMTLSMSHGRKVGFQFGLGLSAGLAFWGLVAATGLGAVLQASSYALFILKLAGGLYLLWLAVVSARAAADTKSAFSRKWQGGSAFKKGLLLNLSNPKAVIAWMAVLALGVEQGSSQVHLALATGMCIALGLITNSVYAFVFSTTKAMRFYRNVRRWIEGAVSGLFALAGFGLIRSALSRQS